jgi:hypothetical protein
MTPMALPSYTAAEIVEKFSTLLNDRFVCLRPAEKATLHLEIEDAMQKWGVYISRVVAQALDRRRDRK